MPQTETGLALLKDREFWNKVDRQITRMMDKAIRLQPSQLLMAAHFSIENNRNLQACTRFSLAQSIIEAGMYGLHLGQALGQSYLIPYKNECKMIVGYKGFGTLAARAGMPMTGQIVWSHDKFDLDYGRTQPIIHIPYIDRGTNPPKDAPHLIGAYAIVNCQGACIVRFHDRREIERRKKFSRATGPDTPWSKFYEAMAAKGPRRDLGAKDIPLDLAPKLVEAASTDDRREFGVIDAEPSDTEQAAAEAATEAAGPPPKPETSPTEVSGVLSNCVKRGRSCFASVGNVEYPVLPEVFDAALKRQGKQVVAHLDNGKIVATELGG